MLKQVDHLLRFCNKKRVFYTFLLQRYMRTRVLRKDALIMTLLVRDEIDIIKHNIDFHLSQGVDYIIATDNASTDGTRDILEEYQERGLLHLIDEPSTDYNQEKWVNRMKDIAYKQYNAGFVFHCDADEFWYAQSKNLKREILHSDKQVLHVPVTNVLLCDRDGLEKFPDNTIYAVMKPVHVNNYMEYKQKIENFFFAHYTPKVIFFGDNDVSQGNDKVVGVHSSLVGVASDIKIYHYPLRSKKQFFQKVINGGSAYASNEELPEEVGFHWRQWFRAYRNGTLEKEYLSLIISHQQEKDLTQSGFLKKISFSDIQHHNL